MLYAVLLAALLQRVFGNIATCYRIGGDEFCALVQDASAAQMEAHRTRAQKELRALVTGYPFAISMGLGAGAAKDIGETFRSAERHQKGNESGKVFFAGKQLLLQGAKGIIGQGAVTFL